MRWPPNKAWTSAEKRQGYRHFEIKQFGGKRGNRWVELFAVNKKEIIIKIFLSELDTDLWESGWIQLPKDQDSGSEIKTL